MAIDLNITRDDEPFWAALDANELRMQRCSECGYVRHPSRWICPECLSEAFEWELLGGHGVVETFVWYLQRLQPWDERLPEPPYNVAIVQLDEGPRVVSTVIGIAPGDLAVSDAVQAVFAHDVRVGRTVLRFAKGAS